MAELSFQQLTERMNPCPPSWDGVTMDEAKDLAAKFKKVFGVIKVDFSYSDHWLALRLNDERNRPPISKCELDHVFTKFVQQHSKQLMDDVWDIENRKVQPRGVNPERIRPHNYEYVVTSRSTNVNIVMAFQPNPRRGGYAVRVNMVTIMRKKGFKITHGEQVMVESADGEQYDLSNATQVFVD